MNLSRLMIVILAGGIFLASAVTVRAQERPGKPNRISWESEEGVTRYQVQVQDESRKTVLDTEVTENHIDLDLKPGKYRLRIGAINKFDKPGDWSEWESLEIKKSKRAFIAAKYPFGAGLKLGGGVYYEMLLPPWNSLYRDAYLNYAGSLSWHLGTTRLGSYAFFKYTGIELEGSYGRFDQKTRLDMRSSMTRYGGGPGLFIRTNFNAPVNLLFKVGGGVLYSRQKYLRYVGFLGTFVPGRLTTIDPYARGAFAIEVFFLKYFYLEAGVQYTNIFYIDKMAQSLRYYSQIGFRI